MPRLLLNIMNILRQVQWGMSALSQYTDCQRFFARAPVASQRVTITIVSMLRERLHGILQGEPDAGITPTRNQKSLIMSNKRTKIWMLFQNETSNCALPVRIPLLQVFL